MICVLTAYMEPVSEQDIGPTSYRHEIAAKIKIIQDSAKRAGEISFQDFVKALYKKGSKGGEGNTLAYATRDSKGHLAPYSFDRRQIRDDDVAIQITHCGICHSDLHQIKNEWGASNYPMVPG